MPIYAYRCTTCGHAQDVLRKISDPALTVCPACGAPTLVKQVTAAGFQLKGSGWYATDFRGDKKSAKPADGEAGESADKKPSEGAGDAAQKNGASQSDEGGKKAEAAPAAAASPAGASAAAAAPAPAAKLAPSPPSKGGA
jgi:putative FmdB family regulatory protein